MLCENEDAEFYPKIEEDSLHHAFLPVRYFVPECLFFVNLMEDQEGTGNQVKFSWNVY